MSNKLHNIPSARTALVSLKNNKLRLWRRVEKYNI